MTGKRRLWGFRYDATHPKINHYKMHFRFLSAKWNAATRYSARPFTTKTCARVHFFCMNSPRNRGWYQARVHPFSSGNGKGDWKVRLIKKRIFGKGHQMTRVLQPQRDIDREREGDGERERGRRRERKRERVRERERERGGERERERGGEREREKEREIERKHGEI